MSDFDRSVDLDKGLNKILDQINKRADELQQRGQDAGEALGDGFDYGIEETVKKIKASSIKTENAFKNLGEKIRKQVQQLTTNVNGKDFKLKIDFSDIDMNSDDIKHKIDKIVKNFVSDDVIEFDTKGSEQQFKNLISLYVKYQEKLNSLQNAAPSLTSSKDIELNLRQQLMLALKLKEIYSFLNQPSQIKGYSFEIKKIADQLVTVQKLIKQTKGEDVKASGDYEELSKVLKEIHTSLKIISDTFKNENNSMQSMAENGVSSFKSLSEAIIAVYNNLSKVGELVNTISQKDFNITNINSEAPVSTSTSKRANVKQLKADVTAEMEHVKLLYAEIDKLLMQLKNGQMNDEFFQLSIMLNELDAPIYENFEETMLGQMADAKTKVKIENLLVVLDGYIDKLTAINKLREKYGLGEWQDPFGATKQTASKEEAQTVVVTAKSPEKVVATSDAEAQQMTNLKGAVDEVSKAIGRKNAGFIKEQEIVNTSVEAEKSKLKELVYVITNEIGVALDNIKEKFAQSFVVPELDENQLRASFDEIYNKFIELKDKIQTMEIDIGFNTANITTAIQEALYAKEIATNYKEAKFEDIFKFDDYDHTWTSRITGEIFDTFDRVDEAFDDVLSSGIFASRDGDFLGTKEEMLADILNKQNANYASGQENWAQVIVEAINTQGGNIVESIKLLLPKNITENIDTVDEKKLTDAFEVLVLAIEDLGDKTGGRPRDFFDSIQKNNGWAKSIRTPEVDDALRTLGLLSESGDITFTIPDTGIRNLGVAIADRIVVNGQHKGNVNNVPLLKEKLDEAHKLGASVPRILSLIESSNIPGARQALFQLQERVPGVNIASQKAHGELAGATNEQIDRLIHTFEVMSKVGLYPDFLGDNILFDKDKGFSLVDLDTQNIHFGSMDTPEAMVKAFLQNVSREANLSSSDFRTFADRVNQRAKLSPEQRLVNADTIGTSQPQVESKPSEIKLIPTMDDGAVANVVAENVAKTPATVNVTPVVDGAMTSSKQKDEIDDWVESYFELSTNGLRGLDFDQQNEAWNKLFDMMPEIGELEHTGKMTFSSVDMRTKVIDGTITADELAQQIRDTLPKDVMAKFALESQKAISDEGQEAVNVAKQFVEAANAKLKFVEANQQVAKSAEDSVEFIQDEEDALEEIESLDVFIDEDIDQEAESHKENAEAIKEEVAAQKELAKVKDVFDDDGEQTRHEDVFKFEEGQAIVTENVATRFIKDPNDPDGARITETMTTIIKDFEAFNKAEKKTEEVVARAQSKLDEFIKKFKSKTGGNAKFIDGFTELSNFKVNKDNIEDAFNNMTQLQAKYNELEENFRKGQSSLNPFTNAITKASNIDNIFGDVEYKFDSLVNKSEPLINNFERLRILSEQIKDFVKKINENPDSITSADFTNFSKQVGEFNLLKTQVEGAIKRESRIEATDIQKQKEGYQEILRLVKERNKALLKAEKNDSGSEAQRNALMDAHKIQQQLHALGKQIVLTEEQKVELARIREEHMRNIRDIEVANNAKSKSVAAEELRKKSVQEYIDLIKKKNEYELKAAKEADGSHMQSFYNAQVEQVKQQIEQKDKRAILNQQEKNRLSAIELEHARQLDEIKGKKTTKQLEQQMFTSQNADIQKRFDSGYLNSNQFVNWQQELVKYQEYLDGITEADDVTIQKQKESLTALYNQLVKMSNASKSFFSSGGTILSEDQWIDVTNVDNMSDALMRLYESIVADKFDGMKTSVTGVDETLGKLNFVVDDGKGSLTRYTLAVDKCTGATKLLQNVAKPALTEMQKFLQSLKKDFTGLLHSVLGGTGIHAIVGYLRKGIQAVRELDLALTELKKVTDETEATYDKFLKTASKIGVEIGSTITQVTQATATFAKLGYSMEMATEMAKAALVYQNVGDAVDSAEAAAESIISTMKGFGLEASNAMSIVDRFNEVGNNFSITSTGIGEALKVSASALNEGGNSLDESIALITAANEVVQNPNTVGTALKTLSLRIRGVKTE